MSNENSTPQGYVLKKKTHKIRNTFIAFALIVGIIIIASVAGDGGTEPNTTDDASTPKTTAPDKPIDKGQPRPVTVGTAFTIASHRFDKGWNLQYEQYIGSKLVGSVTNVSNDTGTAFFHIKFLKGNTVLANFQCNTNDLEPKQVEAIECYNTVSTTKRVAGWDKVTAEATF